jgi:hypothetical protein
MRRFLVAIFAMTSLAATSAASAGLEGPLDGTNATLSLSYDSVSAFMGLHWGEGTLSYGGKTYPVKVEGLSVGELGLTRATAQGKVSNLGRVEDFSGNYVAVGAEATAAGGAGVTVMRNQNGVVVELTSTTQGASMLLGAKGIRLTLAK